MPTYSLAGAAQLWWATARTPASPTMPIAIPAPSPLSPHERPPPKCAYADLTLYAGPLVWLSQPSAALPTLHSYLGEVGDVRGHAAAHVDLQRIANGDVHGSPSPRSRAARIPVLARYDDNVLFPGDTLPLLVDEARDPALAEMVARANAAAPPLRGFFGVVSVKGWLATQPSGDASRSLRPQNPMVGVLAEIRRVGAGAGETRLVARGRARFAVEHPWSLIGGPDVVHFDVDVELLSDAVERPKLSRVFGDAPRVSPKAWAITDRKS
mgnify:CR=1 FL=1